MLPITHGNVITDGIAGNHLMSIFQRYIPAAFANHKGQFAFIIHFIRNGWAMDRRTNTNNTAALFGKKRRVFGSIPTGFFDMIGII